MVKALLERGGVNPDEPDCKGRTPLWWAAVKGHEGVVKALLERDDINPSSQDNDGEIPLHHAAMNGHK